jgi:tetratricopeptide (TPR) repeat protein
MRLTLVFLFCVSFAFSQTNDSQIAQQFYQNGEYEKAIDIFKNLSKGNNFHLYYHPYFNSLVNTKNYEEAEKLSLRMTKKISNSYIYFVDLYMVQLKNGNDRKAKKTLEKINSKLKKKDAQVVSVANTFIKYQMYNQALKCYQVVIENNTKRKSTYRMQIAQLYLYLDKDVQMVEEYLTLIEENPTQKQTVQNYLQRYLNNDGIKSDKNYNAVKNGLLKYSQKEREGHLFTEMLIWLFMQNNQFDLAFLQAKALDKRLKENGFRLYNLAETFLDNEYYNLSIKAYNYIIEKGEENYYYIDAHVNKLYSMGELSSRKENDLKELDDLYKKTIEELGQSRKTILLINNYAHLKALIMHDLISAESILSEAMEIPQLSKSDLAECKLVYADVMLLSDQVWTALLYYSQVEKDFKETPVGHEAKLRRSKISYYQGDFDWAQSQLDILKASTSKLIANDAMDLSLLITDNLNLDTSAVPMEMYARADLLFYQNRFEEAITTLDSILTTYSGHTLSDEIYFRKYQIYQKIGNTDKSIEMLETIVTDYAFDILEDDALFHLAQIYENEKKDFDKAFHYYETILLQCSGSIYTAESRKKYRKLRGDNL